MRKLSILLLVLFSLFEIFILLLSQLGYRLNPSDSIPIGLYKISGSSGFKNKYVIFCPDNRDEFKRAVERGYISKGFCQSGFGYMMKKVVAIEGDIISVTDKGVIVNNKIQSYSTPLTKDGANRALNQWRINDYQLKHNELLTMTDQDKWSFDGRYYGLIKTNQVKGVITPIWVKPKIEKVKVLVARRMIQ